MVTPLQLECRELVGSNPAYPKWLKLNYLHVVTTAQSIKRLTKNSTIFYFQNILVSLQKYFKMRISFDFDKTLEKSWVQDLAKTFIKNGDTVFVITSRSPKISNIDLFNVCEKLGIKKSQIFFVDIFPKLDEIIRLQIDIHFEDDFLEFLDLKKQGVNCVLIDTTNLEFFQQEKFEQE